jgi:hypothetical protein
MIGGFKSEQSWREEKTLIARGTEQVALSNLREGEFVEVTFRSAHTGLVKADAIYAQPEPIINKSKSRAQRRLKSTNRIEQRRASKGG